MVFGVLECGKGFHFEVMLTHVEWHHVVLLQDVLLERVQVLALEEHLGDLLLDSIGVPDLHYFLSDIEVPLCSVFCVPLI